MSKLVNVDVTTYPSGVNDEIRQIIRDKISETGESQAEIARRLGIKPQELNRALQERGKIAPVWSKILDYFHLDLTVKPRESETKEIDLDSNI